MKDRFPSWEDEVFGLIERVNSMKPNKRYSVTPEKVDQIKKYWDKLQYACECELTFNDDYTKIKKIDLVFNKP